MVEMGYPNPNGSKYLLYSLMGKPLELDVKIQALLAAKEVQKGLPLEGTPIYITGKELQDYCK